MALAIPSGPMWSEAQTPQGKERSLYPGEHKAKQKQQHREASEDGTYQAPTGRAGWTVDGLAMGLACKPRRCLTPPYFPFCAAPVLIALLMRPMCCQGSPQCHGKRP